MKKSLKLLLLFLILNLTFLISLPNKIRALDKDASQQPPTQAALDSLNPVKMFASRDAIFSFDTPAGIINRAMIFLFPISGFILFIMIVWGGFEMLGTAASKKSMDAGRQRVTAAIIGFFILFLSYWIVKIVETIFGIKIL